MTDPLRDIAASVRTTDEGIRQALDSLGRPGRLDEAIVFVAAQAFIDLRAALSAVSVPTPLDEDVRAGAALASALMAANYPGDSGEDVDRLTVELLARGYRLARLLPAPQPVPEEPTP